MDGRYAVIPGARDSEGRLFVTTAAPVATDPYVAGLRLTPIGELYVTGLNQAWSPAQLFVNGEQGAWYDPSDLSTLFQDVAGTIPVTADGQPVGLMLDKSGNNNNASQATATARPIYRTDGTYHWLQFDGVDDVLSTAVIDFVSANVDKASAWTGFATTVASPQGRVFGIGGNAPGSFANLVNMATQAVSARGSMGAALITNHSFPSPATGTKVVLFGECDIAATVAADSLNVRQNATPIGGGDAIPGGGTLLNYPIEIAFEPGNAWYLGCDVYSLIIRGTASSQIEIDETEAWVNGKTGAY